MREFAREPFDLATGPVLRAACFGGATAQETVVAMVAHSIVSDERSLRQLSAELLAIYDLLASGSPLPSAPASPAPASPAPLAGTASAADIRFWREHFFAVPAEAPRLRLCRQPQPDLRSFAAGTVTRELSGLGAVSDLGEELSLLTVYYLLLSSYGAGTDIVVGLTADLRTPVGPPGPGNHVSTIGMRFRLCADETFRELADRLRTTAESTRRHAGTPLDAVLPYAYGQTGWRKPLFRHAFSYQDSRTDRGFRDELTEVPVGLGYSRFDLVLTARRDVSGTSVTLTYSEELFGDGRPGNCWTATAPCSPTASPGPASPSGRFRRGAPTMRAHRPPLPGRMTTFPAASCRTGASCSTAPRAMPTTTSSSWAAALSRRFCSSSTSSARLAGD